MMSPLGTRKDGSAEVAAARRGEVIPACCA
jgi:hypothetical protein